MYWMQRNAFILHITDQKQSRWIAGTSVTTRRLIMRNIANWRDMSSHWIIHLTQLPSNICMIVSYAENFMKLIQRALQIAVPMLENGIIRDIMEEILKIRHEIAQLIGFKNFAEYSLATKMAKHLMKFCNFCRSFNAKQTHCQSGI